MKDATYYQVTQHFILMRRVPPISPFKQWAVVIIKPTISICCSQDVVKIEIYFNIIKNNNVGVCDQQMYIILTFF